MQGKVGRGAQGSQEHNHNDLVPTHSVGKRTLVERIDPRMAAPFAAIAPGQTPAAAAGVVQRKPDPQDASVRDAAPNITPPSAGIDKAGFIDHSDGSNIRTGPAESGGQKLRDQPLPPATRVFVSGTHPSAPAWWYVTAYLDDGIVRGYLQGDRVNVNLPEPHG